MKEDYLDFINRPFEDKKRKNIRTAIIGLSILIFLLILTQKWKTNIKEWLYWTLILFFISMIGTIIIALFFEKYGTRAMDQADIDHSNESLNSHLEQNGYQ